MPCGAWMTTRRSYCNGTSHTGLPIEAALENEARARSRPTHASERTRSATPPGVAQGGALAGKGPRPDQPPHL
eukprot:159680-Pyramimonas_sp.AAC.1